jgi:hypothetical protein
MTPGYQRRPAGNYMSCDVQELCLVASGGHDAAELGEKGVILPPREGPIPATLSRERGTRGAGPAARPQAPDTGNAQIAVLRREKERQEQELAKAAS